MRGDNDEEQFDDNHFLRAVRRILVAPGKLSSGVVCAAVRVRASNAGPDRLA